MKPNSTVYIPNLKLTYDISDTKRFGKCSYITQDKVNIFDLVALSALIRDKLKGAKEEDYLLMGGSPVVNSLCFNYLMMRFGRVNLLIFNANQRRYEVRTINEQEIAG